MILEMNLVDMDYTLRVDMENDGGCAWIDFETTSDVIEAASR